MNRSDAGQKLGRWLASFWMYPLLLAGSLVFMWPFLWMAMTSIKLNREVIGDKMVLLPERPFPQPISPYMDLHYHIASPEVAHFEPEVRRVIEAMNYPWPDNLDRSGTITQVTRGVLNKLHYTMPSEFWAAPAFVERINVKLVEQVLNEARRGLKLGRLVVRSYDLQEETLVEPAANSSFWKLNGSARVVPSDGGGELQYDLGDQPIVRLSGSFTSSFTVDRLHWLKLYLRPDNTWHSLNLFLEKNGVRFAAERPYYLNDFANWAGVSWQEPGPDDLTNKVRTWILLREVARGPEFEHGPNGFKVELELRRSSSLGAWWGKIQQNYRQVFDHIPFLRYVGTSLFLALLNVVATLFSCSLVAFAFARLQWPGRHVSFLLMLATLMIPSQVTMIPHFLIIRSLGWYNTMYPLWVPSLFASAFNVFLLRQFLKGIPRDLEDAARIDGCGFWRIYWHIMLPLVKPTLAAIAVFTFMGTWNDFMGPLIYLSDQRLYPLSLGLYAFQVQTGGEMGMMMAGSFLMTLPVIVLFFFAQKYFIQGITLSGTKA